MNKELLTFNEKSKKTKNLTSLYNILKGKCNFSDQEIKNIQIKLHAQYGKKF